MSQSFVRCLLVLREIPTAPNRIDTRSLARRLEGQGIRVSLRTVQRDLERLATALPLQCHPDKKPYCWNWGEGSLTDIAR
jgi:predicted DNA-binding transcriptional regulator YafY